MYTTLGHTIGPIEFEYFLVKVNSDQTEGRGRMIHHSQWETVKSAIAAAKGQGVMGHGNGEIYRVTISYCTGGDENNTECDYVCVVETQIYESYKDKWLDRRYDPLMTDPEYAEYIRLKEKFGGK